MIENAPNCIMNNAQAQEKLYRMSLQIQEDANSNANIVLIGLNKRGYFIAKCLETLLKKEVKNEITLLNLAIDNSVQTLPSIINNEALKNSQVIIIDDVANSGQSFAFAMYAIMPSQPLSIKTLVLVERSHKQFPIKINYKGLTINTTLQEHIEVSMNDANEIAVYLK